MQSVLQCLDIAFWWASLLGRIIEASGCVVQVCGKSEPGQTRLQEHVHEEKEWTSDLRALEAKCGTVGARGLQTIASDFFPATGIAMIGQVDERAKRESRYQRCRSLVGQGEP